MTQEERFADRVVVTIAAVRRHAFDLTGVADIGGQRPVVSQFDVARCIVQHAHDGAGAGIGLATQRQGAGALTRLSRRAVGILAAFLRSALGLGRVGKDSQRNRGDEGKGKNATHLCLYNSRVWLGHLPGIRRQQHPADNG